MTPACPHPAVAWWEGEGRLATLPLLCLQEKPGGSRKCPAQHPARAPKEAGGAGWK